VATLLVVLELVVADDDDDLLPFVKKRSSRELSLMASPKKLE
jgi:hypothetical protein